MATTVGMEKEAKSFLSDLIQLDYDAAEAYEQAIKRLDSITYKSALEKFKRDHERHISEFSEVMRNQGEEPPSKGDIKSLLTQGKVILADLAGDQAILKAMKSNEDDTNTAYERAIAREDLSAEAMTLLEAGLADERRHRAWIESQLS